MVKVLILVVPWSIEEKRLEKLLDKFDGVCRSYLYARKGVNAYAINFELSRDAEDFMKIAMTKKHKSYKQIFVNDCGDWDKEEDLKKYIDKVTKEFK